jgi:hypothetical protein
MSAAPHAPKGSVQAHELPIPNHQHVVCACRDGVHEELPVLVVDQDDDGDRSAVAAEGWR